MKRIIALSGLKQSGKWNLAYKWGTNENVSFIEPYTDNPDNDECIQLSSKELLNKMDEEPFLFDTNIDGFDYVCFNSQLDNDFNIVIVDDDALTQLLKNYEKVTTIWVDNAKAEPSTRVGKFPPLSYDYIFNYGVGDPNEFLEQLAFDLEMVQS